MATPVLIKNRYEIKDVLGRGGMGVVYQAFDRLMRREVALKTLRTVASGVFVDLFYRECSVLSAMVHPNIIEIFDMGEYEEDGALKPYFVMPLLPGRTLYDLIYPATAQASIPLSPQRCADIISQACRGLHAAHECGLLHRDVKPRNIFVMQDDAVKLIDFGVARLLGDQTAGSAGGAGSLNYMAPEQLQLKPLTARSDIFSLATVCYEALTGVHPFARHNEGDTVAAILEHVPALTSSINPLVSRPLAQAVAQAMAKDPRKRFESAAAFADALQRGLRNERPSDSLLTNPQNRLARAQRSFARGDYEFTCEIIEQLEADGIDDAEVGLLKAQLEQALRKQQSEAELATARRYFEKEEYELALRRVAEILEVNPANEAALSLRNEIENKIGELHVSDSLARAVALLENGALVEARQLIEDSLRLRPESAEGRRLLGDMEKREREGPRQSEEQENAFEAAQTAYFAGHFDMSLRHLEKLAALSGQSGTAQGHALEYQAFHNRVKGDYEALQAALADAQKLLANGDTEPAYLLSERLRERFPQASDVQALAKELAARRDDREQEYRRDVESRLANERDLSAQLHILTQAMRARPNDDFFHQQRQKVQAKLQHVTEVVERAQSYETEGRFDYALEEWLCVRDIYPEYPALREQLARVKASWQNTRDKAKAALIAGVEEALRQGDQERAVRLLDEAQAEFQDEDEYQNLKAKVQAATNAGQEVSLLLSRMRKAESDDRLMDIPPLSQSAAALSEHIEPLRRRAFSAFIAAAGRLTKRDWHVARSILQEAARLGTVPPELVEFIRREEREEEVSAALAVERTSETDLTSYRERIALVLAKYPDEARLEERLRLLDSALADQRKQDEKHACASELALLDQELADAKDHARLWETQIRAKNLAALYPDDPEIEKPFRAIIQQVKLFEEAAEALSRDRIQDCYEICDGMLARLPRHYLFQTLRDRAGARHRELGEEYLLRVERWLASEPDLYQREQILKKAQAEFPFETRYADELLQLQRDKGLAESLAAKARAYEERDEIEDALEQWRQLASEVPWYPNIEWEIAKCESEIDRRSRKERAEHLLAEGQEQLAAGQFIEGYQSVHAASDLSGDIGDLLRSVAPHLVDAARVIPPANCKLADAMLALAQSLDDTLRIPKELRARISDARMAEELTACLTAIQEQHEAGDLTGAVATADDFLAHFPDIKQVENVRAHLLVELEQERRERARTEALIQFHDMESQAATLHPAELLNLKRSVHEIAGQNPGDEEIKQRAAGLDAFFSSLAEVREHFEMRRLAQAEEACARALEQFPAHPLFMAALAEAEKQKAESVAQYVAQVKQRLAREKDFSTQAAILREALSKYPGESYLIDEAAAVNAKQQALNQRVERARELEAKQQFGEATREWEELHKAHPWYQGVDAAVERIANARRKEKQDALDRWFRQVEAAIESEDYETASAMIRQAKQQQPDRKVQGLEEKLNAGLEKKTQSDSLLAEGRRMSAEGDWSGAGQAFLRAHELQRGDNQRTEEIAALLVSQIRPAVSGDFAACEKLLSYFSRLTPSQNLPADLAETISRRRQVLEAERANTRKMLDQLSRFATQVERARSKRALSSLSEKLIDSGLLNSRDTEVRRVAGDLSKKLNLRISGSESSRKRENPTIEVKQSALPPGGVAVGALLVLALSGLVFFLSRPRVSGVPVQINVRPEHATIELDGRTCVAPDCNFVLKPGDYVVNLRKDGYKPRRVSVTVKPGDTIPLNLNAALEPLPADSSDDTDASTATLAKIEIRGALPKTRIRLDGADVGVASSDGAFLLSVPPGPHTLDLSLDGFNTRTIKRNFARGEIVSLVDGVVQLVPR